MDIFRAMAMAQEHSSTEELMDTMLLMTQELSSAILRFWEVAGGILQGSSIELLPPPSGYLDMQNNFFSALFLYSYHRAGISKPRRMMYASINQCLRGMVTGCDNILDDEYKPTLRTNLPEKAYKFRSILDIMVSDRVMFELLSQAASRGELTSDEVLLGSAASLRVLGESGAQEASEEMGVDVVLKPADVLRHVHHYKTGKLFLCPWGLPGELEKLPVEVSTPIRDALYDIGMGCQIMDDMADLRRDVFEKRHNYAASLIFHRMGEDAYDQLLATIRADHGADRRDELLLDFPPALQEAAGNARDKITSGLKQLFFERHHFLIDSAIEFLCDRIGTTALMKAAGQYPGGDSI
jgi:hypothetical protein